VSAAIRAPEMSPAASKVSVFSGVRRALVEKQRQNGRGRERGDGGRDIGSVVFPDAQVKIYLDAEPPSARRGGVSEMEERGSSGCREVEREIREARPAGFGRGRIRLAARAGRRVCRYHGLAADEVERVILEIVRKKAL